MASANLVFSQIGQRISERTKSIWYSRIGLVRFFVQIGSLLLLAGGAFGLARTWFPLPVAFPTGSPYSIFWDGFEAIQYLFSNSMIPFIVIGVFMVFSVLTGRMLCGWVCPMGLFQDILSWFPVKKHRPSKPDNDFGNGIKYVLLVGFLVASVIIGAVRQGGDEVLVAGFRTDTPWSLFDPAGTLFSTFYYYFSWGANPANGNVLTAFETAGTYTIIRTVLFVILMLASIKIPRFYCRYLCPTGAMLGIFADKSIVGIVKNPITCKSGCNDCDRACPMMVPIAESKSAQIYDRSCINCGKCVDACPVGALKFTLRIAS